jgi:hypothetical protein
VQPAATTTVLSTFQNPGFAGTPVFLTATVNPVAPGAGPLPVGTVDFTEGTTLLGSTNFNYAGFPSDNTARLTLLNGLSVGTHAITASYRGDVFNGAFLPSTSATLLQTIVLQPSRTVLTSSAGTSVFGAPVTFTATVSQSLGTSNPVLGTVTFFDGNTPLGSATLSSGVATFSTSGLGVGPHSITAHYLGDTTFAGSSGSVTLTVNPAATTTSVTSSVNPSVPYQPLTITIAVSPVAPGSGTPTGTIVVTSTLNNKSQISHSGVLDAGGHATTGLGIVGLSAGDQVTVQVTYLGDGNFLGSTSPTLSQSVQQVAMQVDPADPTKTALAVGGTSGNDNIVIKPADTQGNVQVTLNGIAQGTFHPTGHILMYGGPGNDTISLNALMLKGGLPSVPISVPAVLDGGDGNDTLDARGSIASNILLGGSGDDTLLAGSGPTLLIGGGGKDVLHADSGNAILIGGSTVYDNNLSALLAILAEWSRTDADYNTRILHLTNGGGLNGSNVLTKETVIDDGAVDQLFGSTGNGAPLNWFWASANDKVIRRHKGETVSTY